MSARVLVVDDNLEFADIVVTAAERSGFSVRAAGNGLEAIRLCAEFSPDTIILDIVMPEMDGIELARRATELDPDLKVMFITGFAAVALMWSCPWPESSSSWVCGSRP